MRMDCLHFKLRPRSAFGGPIKGDTFFGQLCWMVRHRWGEDRLVELLAGYPEGRPFAVCSDAFPAGHLPRPALPLHRFAELPDADRKAVKRKRWLPTAALAEPVKNWLASCRSDREVVATVSGSGESARALAESHAQPHNSINRLTGTTGGAEFAPYALEQLWFAPGLTFDFYLLVDSARLSVAEARLLIEDIGRVGYGRDAGIGLGKLEIVGAPRLGALPSSQPDANVCFTLAPVAPQGQGFIADHSHYEVFTRFGRHGDQAVQTGRPFKAPVLLAQTGAVLTPRSLPAQPFVGQGLGGQGQLSRATGYAGTVQQGYAPWIGLKVDPPKTQPTGKAA
jgi:CRISPR-associated protein Csm4